VSMSLIAVLRAHELKRVTAEVIDAANPMPRPHDFGNTRAFGRNDQVEAQIKTGAAYTPQCTWADGDLGRFRPAGVLHEAVVPLLNMSVSAPSRAPTVDSGGRVRVADAQHSHTH